MLQIHLFTLITSSFLAVLPVSLTACSLPSSWLKIISTAVATGKWPPGTHSLISKCLYPWGSSPWWKSSSSCPPVQTACLISASLPPAAKESHAASSKLLTRGDISGCWLSNSRPPAALDRTLNVLLTTDSKQEQESCAAKTHAHLASQPFTQQPASSVPPTPRPKRREHAVSETRAGQVV